MHRYLEDPATGIINRLPPHAQAPDAGYLPLRFAQPPRALHSYLHGRDPRRAVLRSPHGRTILYLARRMHEPLPQLYLASRPGPHPTQRHEILRPVTADQLHGYAFSAVLRYVVVLHGPAGTSCRREFLRGDYQAARTFWERLLLDEPTAPDRPETGRLEMLLQVVPLRQACVAVGVVLRTAITTPLDDLLPAFPAAP